MGKQQISARLVPQEDIVHIECICKAVTPMRRGNMEKTRCLECGNYLILSIKDETATQIKGPAPRRVKRPWPKFD